MVPIASPPSFLYFFFTTYESRPPPLSVSISWRPRLTVPPTCVTRTLDFLPPLNHPLFSAVSPFAQPSYFVTLYRIFFFLTYAPPAPPECRKVRSSPVVQRRAPFPIYSFDHVALFSLLFFCFPFFTTVLVLSQDAGRLRTVIVLPLLSYFFFPA